jgi:hypothetical protein
MMGLKVPPELHAISETIEEYLALDILEDPRLLIQIKFNHSNLDDCIRETLSNYLNLLQETSPYLIEYFEGKNGMDVIKLRKFPWYFKDVNIGQA